MNQTNKLHFEIKIEISSYDIDLAGHVNNIVYIRWLEDLRIHLFQQISPVEDLLKKRLYPVVIKTTITYKNYLKFNDEVIGKVWVEFIKHGIISIRYEVNSKDKIIAFAEQNCVLMNLKSGKMDKGAASLLINKF